MNGFGRLHAAQFFLVMVALAALAVWGLGRFGLRVSPLLALAAVVAGIVVLNIGSDFLDDARARRDLRRLGRLALSAATPEEVARGRALAQALATAGRPLRLQPVPEFQRVIEQDGPLRQDCLRLVIATMSGRDTPYLAALATAMPVPEERDLPPLVENLALSGAMADPLSDAVARVLAQALAAAPTALRRDLAQTVLARAPDQPGLPWVELFRPFTAELHAVEANPRTTYLGSKATAYLKVVG